MFTVSDNDMITSFSNPNYTMMSDDAFNSNLPSSQYYNDNESNPYSEINFPDPSTNTTQQTAQSTIGKNRKTYAEIDLSAMGIALPGAENSSRQTVHKNTSIINTPDSVASIDSEGQDSAYSGGITSPEDKTSEIVQVEHNEDDTEDEADWKPKGFLGYYASLESESKGSHDKNSKNSREEENTEDGTDQNRLTPNSPNDKDGKERYVTYTGVTYIHRSIMLVVFCRVLFLRVGYIVC